MYCEIVYFIEENNCEKRHADLKPRGYNCFWIDPVAKFVTASHPPHPSPHPHKHIHNCFGCCTNQLHGSLTPAPLMFPHTTTITLHTLSPLTPYHLYHSHLI